MNDGAQRSGVPRRAARSYKEPGSTRDAAPSKDEAATREVAAAATSPPVGSSRLLLAYQLRRSFSRVGIELFMSSAGRHSQRAQVSGKAAVPG